MQEFITVEQARDHILERLPRLDPERVFLGQAAGRILAESIEAPENSPRFSNSARDGFAVRWADLEADRPTLKLGGSVAAGEPGQFRVEAGHAARIMTGAPMPEGADTVVMQEHCEVDADANTVRVLDKPQAGRGAWVREAGENMARGEVVLDAGSRLGASEVGLLASFGRSVVSTSRKPRVAIVSTGDELVELDRKPGRGQIINSNAYMLEALVREMGAEPLVLPIAPDDRDAIGQVFERALRNADLVVSSGGVSVGDYDLTREVVDELTGGMKFWKIRMKPGKPLAFGTSEAGGRGVPLIGLPGNPVSCFVCFHQFVRPALTVMQGQDARRTGLPRLVAQLSSPIRTTPRRRTYLSGTLHSDRAEGPVFMPADNQNSGNLRLFCQANAFGIVEEGVAEMGAGDDIVVELI